MISTARIPLLKDHHSHPYLYATLAHCLNLRAINSRNRAMELIGQRCGTGDTALTIVMGWDDSRYPFTEADLNMFPPVVILNTSLHFLIMNRAALERISPHFPEFAAHRSDRAWIERNCARLLDFMMRLAAGDSGRLRDFFRDLANSGVWYAEEMSLAGAAELAYCAAEGLDGRTSFWAGPAMYEELAAGYPGRIRGIKLFADGALGARTARLSRPYRDGGNGVLVYDTEHLAAGIRMGAQLGTQVAVHAIGDSAIDQTLDAVERLEQRPAMIRIEHAQFISRDAAIRAKRLGIILSMQPNFSAESIGYGDRLPEELRERNNPFRMLIDEAGFIPGKDLLFGSDGMPHGAVPALESALFPPCRGQRLNLDEFVAGYCMPDVTHGYIELCIDNNRRTVGAHVILDSSGEHATQLSFTPR